MPRCRGSSARARCCAREAQGLSLRLLRWPSWLVHPGGAVEAGDRLRAHAWREVGEEVEQMAVHDVRLLLLHPVPAERDVLDLERPRDQRFHAERQLTPE